MLEENQKPIYPLMVPVWPLLGQAIFTSLGLFLPLRIEVRITWTLSFRWPRTIRRHTVTSVLPSRMWYKWQQGESPFLSLHSAITGGSSNTLHLPFEPFPQHHPTSLQVQDPHSTSLLWQRDGRPPQRSHTAPPQHLREIGPWVASWSEVRKKAGHAAEQLPTCGWF